MDSKITQLATLALVAGSLSATGAGATIGPGTHRASDVPEISISEYRGPKRRDTSTPSKAIVERRRRNKESRAQRRKNRRKK